MSSKELFGIDEEETNIVKDKKLVRRKNTALTDERKYEEIKVLEKALESTIFYLDGIKDDHVIIKCEFSSVDDEGEPISGTDFIKIPLNRIKDFMNKTIEECEERKQSEIKRRVYDMVSFDFQRKERSN